MTASGCFDDILIPKCRGDPAEPFDTQLEFFGAVNSEFCEFRYQLGIAFSKYTRT